MPNTGILCYYCNEFRQSTRYISTNSKVGVTPICVGCEEKNIKDNLEGAFQDFLSGKKENNNTPIDLSMGIKADNGKPQLALVPPSLDNAVGEILTLGAIKYAPRNWEKGINYSRIVSSLKRHFNSFLSGDLLDKESGKPHLWHVACNIAFLIEFESKPEKYKNFNDLHETKGDK